MIVVRHADSMDVKTFVATEDIASIDLQLTSGYGFVALAIEDGLSETLSPTLGHADGVEIVVDERKSNLFLWVVRCTDEQVLKLRFAATGLAVSASFGSLPDDVCTMIETTPETTKAALVEILETIFARPAEKPNLPSVLRDDHKFALLHGCMRIARRLGCFTAEITLINSALDIRRSRNLLRLLSLAQASNHQYVLSEITAQKAVEAEPAIAVGPFANHRQELEAFSEICRELRSFAERPAPSRAIGERIGYCLHNCLPFAHGGYAMRSHSIAVEMRLSGYDLVAFARPGFPELEEEAHLTGPSREVMDDVPYHFETSFHRRGRVYAYLSEAADYYERMFAKERRGVVQAATNFWTALPAAIAARRLGLPFVYEVRSFWDITREAREPGFRKSRQAWRDEQLETIALSLADHVVTLNEAMQTHLGNYGVEPRRISIAPNCVNSDIHRSVPVDPAKAAEYGIEEGDIVIGYVGAMLGYEGLTMLVEAGRRLTVEHPHVKILIVGADPNNRDVAGTIEHTLAAQIESSPLPDRIMLEDRIPPSEVPSMLALIDICVYPRLGAEVCELVSPLKPLEAMAAEKAVVLSDVGGMRDIVVDGKTGIVHKADDVDDLRDALKKLIENPGLRRMLGQNARDFVVNQRNWSISARRIAAAQEKARENHDANLPRKRRESLLSSVNALQSPH